MAKEHIPSLEALIARPVRDGDDWQVVVDDNGEVNAAVSIAAISPIEMQLRRLFVREGAPDAVGVAAVAAAVNESRRRGARRMMTRVHDRFRTDAYAAALEANDFRSRGGRVEFKTPLEELPRETPGELAWRATDDVAEAAALLAQVAVGDPGSSADEDAVEFIEGEFAAPDSITRMEIGSLDGAAVAFVLAEVEPRDGWSTLSYFGVTPAARGRGLGLAAHRHGMEMLRAMGGKLYHGGCSLENAAMIAVFRKNGCREFARMREWDLLLEVDDG